MNRRLLRKYLKVLRQNNIPPDMIDIHSADSRINDWDELREWIYDEYEIWLRSEEDITYEKRLKKERQRYKYDKNKQPPESDFHERILSPLKGKAKNRIRAYGFDIETYQYESTYTYKNGKTIKITCQEFLMGSVVGNGICKVFWDRNDMIDFMLSPKMAGSWYVATNLSFDFSKLMKERARDFHLINRNGLIAATYRRKKKKTVNGKRKTRIEKYTFTDTLNYIQKDVEGLGKMLNLPKLPYPACFMRKPRDHAEKIGMETYNIRDSLISYKAFQLLIDFNIEMNIDTKLTIGSNGQDYWRRNWQEYPMLREPDWMLPYHFRGSLRGGITTVFKRGTYEGKAWYYDYRSHYPGRMVEGVDGKGSYPDPSTHVWCDNPNTEHIENYEGICEADITAPYSYAPYLAYKHPEGRSLLPYGTFSGWFCNYELRKAMDRGYTVIPKKMIYYHSNFRPFKGPVEALYKKRKEYKDEGNPMEQMVKVLMNSGLFGKWGFNFTKTEEAIPGDKIEFDLDGNCFYVKEDGAKEYLSEYEMPDNPDDLFSGFVTHKIIGKPPRYSAPILSSYTTALGRDTLMTDIERHPDHIIYCDTDSAIVKKNVFEEGYELGDWELEHILNGIVAIKAKLYMLNKDVEKEKKTLNIVKSKGVGKYMSNTCDFYKSLYEGHVDMQRFVKYKESWRCDLDPGTIINIRKHLSLEDTKRSWSKAFDIDDWQDSEPLRLVDGEMAST